MDADEFWRLIDLLGPGRAGGRVDDLDAALMAGGQSQIEEFDDVAEDAAFAVISMGRSVLAVRD